MQREVAYGVATGISGAVNRKLAPLYNPKLHYGLGLSVGAAVGAVFWLSLRKRARLNRLEEKLDLVVEEAVAAPA
jgi:hypothetical protein